MAQKRNALGRGLDALLSMDEVQTEGSSSINEIELSKIVVNPNQPRHEFDETALQELADSISEIGIIQPITLRKLSDDEYQIIAGERRFRASQLAGLTSIPAYIRTADDENVMEMALIENIQREDLNSVEIALAYQHLLEQYGLTQERLSERVGKKRTTIANYLRLLNRAGVNGVAVYDLLEYAVLADQVPHHDKASFLAAKATEQGFFDPLGHLAYTGFAAAHFVIIQVINDDIVRTHVAKP